MRFGLLAAAAVAIALPAFTPAKADVQAGVEAWQRGDYRRAVEEWRGPAVAGDADAQFNLGQAYKLGRGVPVDPQMAESWFRKAALQGHAQAGDNYALALFQAGRKADAVPWLERSVARDEPRTELVYGTMLFNGDGVSRDYIRAYALMTRAAAPRPASPAGPATNGLQSARETLAQMDGFVSPTDRERGVAVSQQIALTAQSQPVAGAGPLRVTEEGARPVEPRPTQMATTRPASTASTRPATARPAQTASTRPPRDVPAPRPAPPAPPPRPAAVTVSASTRPAAARGNWRVQLGAFRDRGNAEGLWARVRGRMGGASPAYVAAGAITRLQATGFASRAEAQAACGRAGTACTVIAP